LISFFDEFDFFILPFADSEGGYSHYVIIYDDLAPGSSFAVTFYLHLKPK
jgi:hypothetical protein